MSKVPAWLALFTITLVAGLFLAVMSGLTSPVIAQQTLEAAEASRAEVLPAADAFAVTEISDSAPIDWCYAGSADGSVVGYVAQITVAGFGGDIEVIVGADLSGTITGLSVGGASFAETAGLGAKTRETGFTAQFVGKDAPLTVIKAGGAAGDDTIDAVTAATISSKAVTAGVNAIIDYFTGQGYCIG